jgi:hypothetical protein
MNLPDGPLRTQEPIAESEDKEERRQTGLAPKSIGVLGAILFEIAPAESGLL